jgi:hypothetical protein
MHRVKIPSALSGVVVGVGGNSADVHLIFPEFNLQQAWRANAVEENQEKLPVSGHSLEVKMRPHEILTLRIATTFALNNQHPSINDP